jgi:hypothetical protein
MADHKHGEMDITEQKKTFEGFVGFATWAVIIVLAVLIFMALVNG